MSFSAPMLPQFPSQAPDEVAIVTLSDLTDDLIVRVPDPQDIPPNWDVYPILGANPQEPEWQGVQQPTGIWDDVTEDMLNLARIELTIAKAELEKYLGAVVALRYKFADESSLEPCSEPLLIRVER